MLKELALGGGTLRYELIRKKVKRINLRVRADGSVTVSASRLVPLCVIEDFLRQKEAFLRNAIRRAEERKRETPSHAAGSSVRLWGEELALHFEKGGRSRAVREGDALRLYLREPEEPAAREAALAKWEKEQCEKAAAELLERWYPVLQPFGVPRPMLRFRRMSSRWGSCIPKKGAVTLNTRLLAFPESCMEYVLIHELCHLLQPDHSQKFRAWLDRFLPDWRERKRLLDGKEP